MSWTPPLTWTDGLLVAASLLNQQLRDNLRYLKGQLGAIHLENAIDLQEIAPPANPSSGSVRIWNTNAPFRQMLYARFADGTQRRITHYATRMIRTTSFVHVGNSWQVVPCNVLEFSSHPSLALHDGIGFVAPEDGVYVAVGVLFTGTPAANETYVGIMRGASTIVAGSGGGIPNPAYTTVAVTQLNSGETLRLVAFATSNATFIPLSYSPTLSVFSI